MRITLDHLNRLPADQAAESFRACCGSARWIAAMVSGRPYSDLDTLLGAAESAWRNAGPEDWEEAFAHHPRIGEPPDRAGGSAAWSATEQRGALESDEPTRRVLAETNAAYQRRFGRRYIVCATGRTAEEILADLRARVDNDPVVELRVAAAEQGRITAMRLRKLIEDGS